MKRKSKKPWPYQDTDVFDPREDPGQWRAAVNRSEN